MSQDGQRGPCPAPPGCGTTPSPSCDGKTFCRQLPLAENHRCGLVACVYLCASQTHQRGFPRIKQSRPPSQFAFERLPGTEETSHSRFSSQRNRSVCSRGAACGIFPHRSLDWVLSVNILSVEPISSPWRSLSILEAFIRVAQSSSSYLFVDFY